MIETSRDPTGSLWGLTASTASTTHARSHLGSGPRWQHRRTLRCSEMKIEQDLGLSNRFILYYRRVVNTKPWDIPNFEPFAICGDSDTNYLGKNKKMCKTPVWLILVVVKSQSVFQSEPHVGKGLPSHQPTVVCYVSIRSSLAPSAQLVISFNYIQPQSISHGHPPWRLV